jgi:membrane associated rhomboid family serine protease
MPPGNNIDVFCYATRCAMPEYAEPGGRSGQESPLVDTQAPKREPPLKGPWPVWAIVGLILGSFALQTVFMSVPAAAGRFGVSGVALREGHWATLVTALFIHGSWAHAGMNAAGALAFGAPVARLFGMSAKGAGIFLLFYLLCGILAGLGYASVHPHDPTPLVGASGAISGLFGGASRLIEHRPGLSPFRSRTVLASAASWVVVNVILGLMHYAPGIGDDVQVGWEAHIAGYAAGLVLIGPFMKIFAAPQLVDLPDLIE